ncbi:zinc ribbon domain-containing protein [Dictyobacter aurantiacus]|uniref:Zinc-ribbon domain-containing protein n=1 Tax=Dictyobacter aurantiacus TaxID=1936993 RepID=A0A401Z7Q5_9CHLR|nr:zinc ribbon domain-containing protein [Dictyobacter aurantiacus]GCE02848.1 hypothetical protein KDAU_01770 [Dictyobacter aurantiacus]
MKPIVGQYECVHSSGVGLDYFTSRIDRLVLQSNGSFVLTTQTRSRAANAAQSLLKGQQVSPAAPETRMEGTYTQQDLLVYLQFNNGGSEQAHLPPDGSGIQVGPNYFTKVSDSTLLPPTHRLQKDMDDIAKGLKIASTLGGMAVKAAKTIHGTIQSVQESGNQQPAESAQQPAGPSAVAPARPASAPTAAAAPQQPPAPQRVVNPTPAPPPGQPEAIFCDQCGARCRPGKRFCNSCGARLA